MNNNKPYRVEETKEGKYNVRFCQMPRDANGRIRKMTEADKFRYRNVVGEDNARFLAAAANQRAEERRRGVA